MLTQEEIRLRQREYERRYRERKKAEAQQIEEHPLPKDECRVWYTPDEFPRPMRYTRPPRTDGRAAKSRLFRNGVVL